MKVAVRLLMTLLVLACVVAVLLYAPGRFQSDVASIESSTSYPAEGMVKLALQRAFWTANS